MRDFCKMLYVVGDVVVVLEGESDAERRVGQVPLEVIRLAASVSLVSHCHSSTLQTFHSEKLTGDVDLLSDQTDGNPCICCLQQPDLARSALCSCLHLAC